MVDNHYKKIKERMKTRSMELWGIEDHKFVDPIIELLLDVFSYELSKIHQEIKLSDAKLLERLAKILVDKNWSLPIPSHALLQARPLEEIEIVDAHTQLYFQKHTQEGIIDVFFTPIKKHKLIDARVSCKVFDEKLVLDTDTDFFISSKREHRIEEQTIWIGIDIADSILETLEELPVSVLLRDSNLTPYLKVLKVCDIEHNEVAIKFDQEEIISRPEHYYATVMRFYQDNLYTLNLKNSTKKKQTIIQKFGATFNNEELKDYDKALFWLAFKFPVPFTKEELDKVAINLNTFPIVNRKKEYRQHQIKRNGKIVSLHANESEYFLNIESLKDNLGNEYASALENDISDLAGSYSLYFGDIEQFDKRNAKAVLNQVIQTVREEGSSFSAVGYDLLNAYLEDLNKKLNELEQKVNFRYKNVSESSDKLYLLTIPHQESETYECDYWTTTGTFANTIKSGTICSQYQTGILQADSLKLLTDTVGGNIKTGKKEKINSLRYGLISKDRIVSNEDIKAFIKKNIGETISKITISSGVAISHKRKQGLIRTIHIEIEMDNDTYLTSENKKRLEHYLQRELEHKSIHNTPYCIHII